MPCCFLGGGILVLCCVLFVFLVLCCVLFTIRHCCAVRSFLRGVTRQVLSPKKLNLLCARFRLFCHFFLNSILSNQKKCVVTATEYITEKNGTYEEFAVPLLSDMVHFKNLPPIYGVIVKS